MVMLDNGGAVVSCSSKRERLQRERDEAGMSSKRDEGGRGQGFQGT